MALICKICNTKFECDVENGKDKCWCFEYPNILPIDSKKCICKKCLENTLKSRIL